MINTQRNTESGIAALLPRTLALLILLYQLRLLAADLADTSFFIMSLAGALLSVVFLYRVKFNGRAIKPLQAIIILALVPWAIRFFIAAPRWFLSGVSNNTVLFDSLLLNFDRNNFVALLPFYWMAFSTWFSRKSRVFLRADIILADIFFLVLFSITPSASMDAYRWPVLMIALFSFVIFLQVLSLILSLPPEFKLRRREVVFSAGFLFFFIFIGGALFLRPFQERAVEKGGGLLKPNLFRFDFSKVLRLESEISVNDDLVMIVKKDPDDYHNLLRRYTLSGYNQKQGFFRLEDTDEAAHPASLPERRKRLPANEILEYRVCEQEYYLVNFDASAFIGINMPVEIIPFETWDASSFNSAYAVQSHTSQALPFELIDAVQGKAGPESLALSAEEYALYTEYGNDEEIASFAREIIQENEYFQSYWVQVEIIYEWLKYGEYRYSLKPGIAPNGDPLKYFLFESKKGYCSYYAFAFTMLLRSLGIPCRVAAGFYTDPATEVFNYYPIRNDMAHAWVEVWFPGYGWIEYDPTTELMAEGEEFIFSRGTSPELFERLMKEILENRSKLKVKERGEAEAEALSFASLGEKAIQFFKKKAPFITSAVLVFLILAIRSGFFWLSCLRKPPRKKTLELWAHIKRRLALAGHGKPLNNAEAEWATEKSCLFGSLYLLYLNSAAARFAPRYTTDDNQAMVEHYRHFVQEYKKIISIQRRLLAWVLPPLALILKAHVSAPSNRKPSGPVGPGAKTAGIVLALAFLFSLKGETSLAQESSQADALFENALAARHAENWERAVELFSDGAKTHPLDFRFSWSLGNLYYNRKLYRLAWDEYQTAEKINPWDFDLLFRLAYTAGYLNKNEVSADYFKKILILTPGNREAITALGWMYFKTHRLMEGEHLLLDAIKNIGEDRDIAMTLGFIYSDMYRYDDAKNHYIKAIREAEDAGDQYFKALAYYNLSILESRFYQYGLAYDSTNFSLGAMNRASGRLARGELYERRMELSRSLSEFQEAYGMDNSPLSRLNLARVYVSGGRLSEAVLYAEDCLKANDESWMLNYGIDPVRYRRDIHEVLNNAFEGLFRTEAFSAPETLKERAQSLSRRVSYKFRATVHSHLFHKYGLIAANAYSGAGESSGKIHLDALIQYYQAFQHYPRRALAYLHRAREFEEPLIPASIPSYNYEEGRTVKNRKTLEESLEGFDPVWEREMIASVYTELALRGKKAARQDAAERLFAINQGALLQKGIRLPVDIHIDIHTGIHVNETSGARRIIKSAVKAAGLETAKTANTPRYTLSFSSDGDASISCVLYDRVMGITVWIQKLPLGSSKAFLARTLRDGVFNAF